MADRTPETGQRVTIRLTDGNTVTGTLIRVGDMLAIQHEQGVEEIPAELVAAIEPIAEPSETGPTSVRDRVAAVLHTQSDAPAEDGGCRACQRRADAVLAALQAHTPGGIKLSEYHAAREANQEQAATT